MPRFRPGRAWVWAAVLVLLVGSGCSRESGSAEKAPAEGRRAEQRREVLIYFPESAGGRLLGVRRPIPTGGLPIDVAVQALLSGPTGSESLLPAVPTGTRLLGLSVTGGRAYLNFSPEFAAVPAADGGSPAQALYAIVNSLTEFPNVTRVFFLVEGQPLTTYLGIPVTEGLQRRPDLIRAEKSAP